MITRKKTKKIKIGDCWVGGESPILVQSMTNTDTRDAVATIGQIKKLEAAGCEIIRCAVPDEEAARSLKQIKAGISIPLVADIHFDHKLALLAIESGVDKIRINPGNIGSEDKVKAVVAACKERNIPIRIGVNIGSLQRDIEEKYGRSAKAMVESAKVHIGLLEKFNFTNILVSLKASDVLRTVEAYDLMSDDIDYPLHVGITESGTIKTGTIKSSVGLGVILARGIGDTIRVSLTGDPVEEVRVAWEILKSLNIRQRGPILVSCPTCGRTQIDLIKLANEVEEAIANIEKPIKVAVMGCVVNGPGEAKEADIGIAGGKGRVAIFKKGEVLRTVPEKEALRQLMSEIDSMLKENQ